MKKLIGIMIIICVLMSTFIISSNADEEGEPVAETTVEEAVEEVQEVHEGETESQEVAPEKESKDLNIKNICIFLSILFVIFLVGLILINGLHSIRVVISSALSILVIGLFFLKALLWGWNIILIIALTTLIILIFNLGILKGFNQRFVVAFLGEYLGCVLIGLTIFIFTRIAKLFGICEEIMSINNFGTTNFNYTHLMITLSVVLALGMCLEIGYGIANFLFDNKDTNTDMKLFELIKSARRYGKEIVSSEVNMMMFNILCIMNIVFLFMQFSNFVRMTEYELYTQIFSLFVCEVLGILYTIVCTAFVFWVLYSKQTEYRKKSSNIVEGKRSLKL